MLPGRPQTRPTLGLGLNARLGLSDDPLEPALGEEPSTRRHPC